MLCFTPSPPKCNVLSVFSNTLHFALLHKGLFFERPIRFNDNAWKWLQWTYTETNFHWFCTHFIDTGLDLGLGQYK